jgi:galactose mutarotase-like enzyme
VFAISSEQQQYKTYTLSDQSTSSRLEVLPERGGIVTSWQIQGKEIFYLDTERLTHPELSVRGGIPILFPICGNLPDNTYTYQGQSYTLKQHGFAREMPWEVVNQSTQDAASLTVRLSSTPQTLVSYPFEFQVDFTYQLQGNSLKIVQEYTNLSDQVMPFVTGLHPYFAAPEKSQLRFEIPGTQYWDHRTQTTQPYPGTFDLEQDEIDVAFREVSSPSAAVTDLSQQLKLTLEYDDHYSTVVFWAVKGKDFYCLEPWTAPRNTLVTGEHLLHVEPKATLKTTVGLMVDFI